MKKTDKIKHKTLPEILFHTSKTHPKHGIGFYNRNGETDFLFYPDLLSQSKKMLAGLQGLGYKKGDKVILCLYSNKETIPVLWACFLGGIIPTILQAPISFIQYSPVAEKLLRVSQKFNPKAIIVSDALFEKWDNNYMSRKSVVKLSDIPQNNQTPSTEIMQSSDTAFVQFSSGSTGNPKGIILTHKNLLSNVAAINNGLKTSHNDTTVNWMPLYHDMGLIGYHISPIFGSLNQYLIDTIEFIKRPFLWIDAMSQKKATITGSPNFGLAITLRYLKRKTNPDWDLSSIKAMLNGAEPISISIMDEFIEKVSPFGFRREAMMPVYGLAEATLAVSFTKLLLGPVSHFFDRQKMINLEQAVLCDENNHSAYPLIGVGKALNDVEIKIVDDEYKEVIKNHIGQILLKGDGITNGYYNNKTATEASFINDWFNTGDKGFWHNNDLYISGRIKDIIFFNGKNYFANDLEYLALQIEGVEYGKLIISGVFDEKSGFDKVLLFLVGGNNQRTIELFQKINTFFRNSIGISVSEYIPIKSNEIPKTSSGKIQRFKMVNEYLKGKLKTINLSKD